MQSGFSYSILEENIFIAIKVFDVKLTICSQSYLLDSHNILFFDIGIAILAFVVLQ